MARDFWLGGEAEVGDGVPIAIGMVVGDADDDGAGGAAHVNGLGEGGKADEQGKCEKEIFHGKTGFRIFAKIKVHFQ